MYAEGCPYGSSPAACSNAVTIAGLCECKNILQRRCLTVKGYVILQQASMPGGCKEGVHVAFAVRRPSGVRRPGLTLLLRLWKLRYKACRVTGLHAAIVTQFRLYQPTSRISRNKARTELFRTLFHRRLPPHVTARASNVVCSDGTKLPTKHCGRTSRGSVTQALLYQCNSSGNRQAPVDHCRPRL